MKQYKMRGKRWTLRGGLYGRQGWVNKRLHAMLYLVLKATLKGRHKLADGTHIPSGTSISGEERNVCDGSTGHRGGG